MWTIRHRSPCVGRCTYSLTTADTPYSTRGVRGGPECTRWSHARPTLIDTSLPSAPRLNAACMLVLLPEHVLYMRLSHVFERLELLTLFSTNWRPWLQNLSWPSGRCPLRISITNQTGWSTSKLIANVHKRPPCASTDTHCPVCVNTSAQRAQWVQFSLTFLLTCIQDKINLGYLWSTPFTLHGICQVFPSIPTCPWFTRVSDVRTALASPFSDKRQGVFVL